MSLRDEYFTPDQIRQYSPPADPLLYVPADYSAKLEDILELPIVSLSGKLWAASQFFQEKYHRQWVFNCIKEAVIYCELEDKTFFDSFFPLMQEYIDGEKTAAEALLVLEPELKEAGYALHLPTEEKEDYSRLLWALYWSVDPTLYRENMRKATRDVVTVYGNDAEAGWLMCKAKFLEVLEIHP